MLNMENAEKSMGQTRRLGGKIISTYTKQGVCVFRLVKHRRGKTLIGERFNMRVYRGAKRVYFPLAANLPEAKKQADAIDAYLKTEGNTLDGAVGVFRADSGIGKS